LTKEIGEQPKRFDPDIFFKHSMGITTSHQQPERVLFRAKPVASKYIRSQPFHSSQSVHKETNSETFFELYVLISEELIRAFLSYGGEVEVLEPNELRTELKTRIQQMYECYNK
jgi:predicted DNA-binding transcriptional regulator YafY